MVAVIKRILKTAYDLFPIFNRPMAACGVFCIAAVLYLYGHAHSALSILALFLVFAVTICLVTRNKKFIIISIFFLAVCASAVNELALISDLNDLDGKTVTADFVAIEDTVYSDKASRVTAYCCKSDELPVNSKFVLYSFYDFEISCGDKFNAEVKLTKLNDDKYKAYNYGNSVYVNSQLKRINKYHTPNKFFLLIGKFRRYLIKTIWKNFSENSARIMIALNYGDKSFLTGEFYNKVLICGVSHVMVVSGLHISIIIGSVFIICEHFFYNRFLKAAIAFVAIFFLCAVCGFSLSVVRAGIMFIFSAAAPLLLRKNDLLNSLGSAVVLMLYISPFCIYSVAFQLSVMSMVAVVWVSPFYSQLVFLKLGIESKLLKSVIGTFIVSVTALIFTAPVTIATFGTISAMSPISFLLITLPVTIALVLNSAALTIYAIKGISVLAKPLFFVTEICARYIYCIIDNLGILDFMLVKAGIIEFIVFVFLALVLIVSMCVYKFYIKLLRRSYLSEVKIHGGNI